MAQWPFVSLGRYSRQPISCFLHWQSSHRRRHSGRYGSHQENREILDPVFSVHVRAYSSRKSWHLQFHDSELYFRTRPQNLCSHKRCEKDLIVIPMHFYHATTLQFCAFARHSASWPARPMTHKRNFVCDDGDLSPPLFQSGFCNFSSNAKFHKNNDAYFCMKITTFPYTLDKRIATFLVPEAFCGVKYAENVTAAGAPPRAQLGELTTLPRPPSRLGSGHLPILHSTQRLDARTFGTSIVVLRGEDKGGLGGLSPPNHWN